jgi:hypothetical protein
MSTPVPTGGKHALLIGIDRYPKLAAAHQLKGCVNDAHLLRGVLQECFAFPPAGIVVLQDEEATREAILASFQSLADTIRPDDVVVVGYSGHGSRKKTGKGPTGWDESIVPFDSGRAPDPNLDIIDDEIHGWLLRMAQTTPNITLVFDSCFSGGITRDPFEQGVRWVPPDEEPTGGTRGGTEGREESGWRALGDRYTLIAGCRSDESAREIHLNETSHGALTHFLCRELLGSASREASARDIFERAAASVTAQFPAQHPLLEGARDREPFGPHIFDTMRFLPVRSRQEGRAVIEGGAAHGLTIGSEWTIYPQGTHQITLEMQSLGRVKVRSVRAVTAEVEIVEEAQPDLIQAGDRAIETGHDYGEMRFVLEACGPDSVLAALSSRIEHSSLLRLARPGETGAVRVYYVQPRQKAEEGDPVPQLGVVRAPVWVVVGPDGRLLAPQVPASQDDSLVRLIENLETRARHRLTLGIENPGRDSLLRDRIEVTLLRWEDGKWVQAKAEKGGMLVYKSGERFDLQVINRSRQKVYVHVLDLGITGQIEVLYPVPGAMEELQPDQVFRIGEKRGQDLEFYLPESLPFENPCGKTEGLQHLKVLATIEPADFSPLIQQGVKHLALQEEVRSSMSPLELLLADAVVGSGTRETRPVQNALHDDWTAVTRSLLIRRA